MLQSLKNNISHALPTMSNVQRPTLQALCLSVPEPLEPRDFQARELFPWRSFLGRSRDSYHFFSDFKVKQRFYYKNELQVFLCHLS